ncbi:MAG TPA: hypothetical protein VFJ16_17645 [Longimicrobium sp.]|nr:hypothetical protein [Longimicrobium sp.]
MNRKLKLSLDDLQVSSLVADDGSEFQAVAAGTFVAASCYQAACASEPGGRLCVTQQYGGGETCESGPYYYC